MEKLSNVKRFKWKRMALPALLVMVLLLAGQSKALGGILESDRRYRCS